MTFGTVAGHCWGCLRTFIKNNVFDVAIKRSIELFRTKFRSDWSKLLETYRSLVTTIIEYGVFFNSAQNFEILDKYSKLVEKHKNVFPKARVCLKVWMQPYIFYNKAFIPHIQHFITNLKVKELKRHFIKQVNESLDESFKLRIPKKYIIFEASKAGSQKKKWIRLTTKKDSQTLRKLLGSRIYTIQVRVEILYFKELIRACHKM